MNTITIPQKITKGDELIIISRVEYERLCVAAKTHEFHPTIEESKDLARARKNRKAGKFLTLDELKGKLGFTH